MKVIYSPDHYLHQAKFELVDGQPLPPFENPTRIEYILQEFENRQFGEILLPRDFGLDPILKIHPKAYVDFLKNIHSEWSASRPGDAIPSVWPNRGLRMILPECLDGKLGYYSIDSSSAITATTWQAILSSVNVALTATNHIIAGESSAFALCRPPGHHAHADLYGGFCFFNNAAVAAQYLLDQGSKKVAILDIDYHHGNGTQAIFYNRKDVLFVSIHADPNLDYPHYLGFADEKGEGQGLGYNINYPLAFNTDWSLYCNTLTQALNEVQQYTPDVLIISLGVDTYELDPISNFKLKSENFTQIGKMIAELKIPTLFVMEGGYAVQAIGVNVTNVLSGFESA